MRQSLGEFDFTPPPPPPRGALRRVIALVLFCLALILAVYAAAIRVWGKSDLRTVRVALMFIPFAIVGLILRRQRGTPLDPLRWRTRSPTPPGPRP